ncbi:MAG: hypothetical protein JXR40_06430 [Pontiellaceae bacterium]|nr:hypothetical protein [Pontiellaceae bacterium]
MNILFITFGKLSIADGTFRSVSFLSALADAGHQVDVAAADVSLSLTENVTVLCGGSGSICPRRRIRLCVLRALKDKSYDVVHAVDDAFIFVSRFARLKRIKTVYEASRCFSGPKGVSPNWFWKTFSKRHELVERKLLDSADLVFSFCDLLTSDLKNISKECRIVQMEDTPIQSMFSLPPIERGGNSESVGESSMIVVCRVLHTDRSGLKKIVLALRKLLDKVPQALFYFVGPTAAEVGSMAANLDIRDRCSFIPPDQPERYWSVLSIADLVLFVPRAGDRYPHAEIMSLLNSSALVVAVHDEAYAEILTEENCVLVHQSTSLMAEGLLRSVQEPLLAYGLVNNAQQILADRYSFSSFKYRVRKAYRELAG